MTDAEETIKFEPKSLCIKIAIYGVVMLVGAAVFMELERAKSDSTAGQSQAVRVKAEIAEKYNISWTDLSKLEDAFRQEESDKGEAERLSRWTYSNSVFFAFTIMTTIGKRQCLTNLNFSSYWEQNKSINKRSCENFGMD